MKVTEIFGSPGLRPFRWGWLRVGHGSLFQNPTQPKISGPDPTQPIIDTWYGILGYTENFIQQLLPYIQLVDSTFYKPTVNESYYSAAVLINRL